MNNEVLFTRKETAAILKIKPRTIWYWEKRGIIKPALYINGRPRYLREDIVKIALDQQTTKTTKP
jgi:DNA-binding transcriptional MerR regulator